MKILNRNTHHENSHYTIMQLGKVIYRDKGNAFSARVRILQLTNSAKYIGNHYMGAISLCKQTPLGILILEMLLSEHNTFIVTFGVF